MGKGFKEGSTSIGKTETKWTGFMIFLGKYRTYLYVALALFIAAFSFTMVREVHKVFMLDLTSASDDALKRVLFSEDLKPYIFHCAKRDKTSSSSNNSSKGVYVTSPIYDELFKLRKDEYNFAKLNCYQILPSGKNIFDRFSLDKKSLPVIFGNSPWLIKPLQAKGSALSTVHNLAAFFDKEVATPHATPISDDAKLHSHCKFNKKPLSNISTTTEKNEESNKDDKTNTSCIVLMRGALFTEKHSEVEGQLIKKFPKQRFAVVDALKYRFTFERPFEHPASSFGYKLIVLRNDTHWRTMGDKYFSIDDSSDFVSTSLSSPISEFHIDNSNTSTSRIKLLKANSPFFKRAKKSKNSVRDDSDENDNDDDEDEDSGTKTKQKSTPKQRSKGAKKTASSSSSSSSDSSKQSQEPPPPEPVVLTDEEVAKRVRDREQAARARMGERDDIRFDEDDNDDGEQEEEGVSFDGNDGETDDDSSTSKVNKLNGNRNSHENDVGDEDVIEL